jgi:hypothetical protein
MIFTAFLYLALPAAAAGADTTQAARQLVLDRIDALAASSSCRHPEIDLARARRVLPRIRFYSSEGAEGELRFSRVVGRPASPDLTLRELARQSDADAFVLGFYEGPRYVRTRAVVLARGYFEQPDAAGGARPTTEEEKQALLLHEVLHIALDKDDDALNQRELCPLRLLAFCPRASAVSGGE